MRRLLALLTCVAVFGTAIVWSGTPPTETPLVSKNATAKFWKGNLHTHTLWSDGNQFPEMVADWYKARGYHFLSLTDHDVLSEGERWIALDPKKHFPERYVDRFGEAWVERRDNKGKAEIRLKPLEEFRSLLEEPGRFLLIQGEEITKKFAKFPVHVNAINVRDRVVGSDGAGVKETVQVSHRLVGDQRQRTKRPMFAFLNHPNFGYGVRAEDFAALEEARLFEVYNGHPGVKNYGDETHASTERIWDIILAQRIGKHRLPLLLGLATDDAHNYHEVGPKAANPGRGWIMVRSRLLTAESLVRAIEAGDFYASTGVVLRDVGVQGMDLFVSIEPRAGVEFTTEFIATMRDAPLDGTPVLDKDGKELPVTKTYSPEIGKVVGSTAGNEATYRMTGNELCVRARVTSSRAHPNPFKAGDREMAWTQPIAPK